MTETVRRILIAYDFSAHAECALTMGLAVARRFSAEVLVLNVINQRDIAAIEQAANRSLLVADCADTEKIVREYEEDRAQQLKESLAPHCSADMTPQALVRIGDPVEEILEVAKAKRSDLIVMGARGRNRVSRLLTGSKAETVFRLSPIAILSVRDAGDNVI
ncbi:MAG: universal stress protein [Pseudomonadota bacterium]